MEDEMRMEMEELKRKAAARAKQTEDAERQREAAQRQREETDRQKAAADCVAAELSKEEEDERQQLDDLRRQIAQLQREEQELRRKQEVAERETQVLRKKLEAAERETKAVESRLLRHGFPPLRGPYCSSCQNVASQNVSHAPLSFTSSDFHAVDGLPLIAARPLLWDLYDWDQLAWASESDIQIFVRLALGDVIEAAGYVRKLDVLSELSLFNLSADGFVVRSNDRPIGVFEVKRPNEEGKPSALLEPHLARKIFDHMMRLRQFSGLRYVFGLVTTYNEWRICWLRDTDECAASPTAIPSICSPAETDLGNAPEVHCSPIYQRDAPVVISLLASVLHKMQQSPASPPTTLLSATRLYIRMGPKTYDWSQLPASTTELSYHAPPAINTQHFFMLQDYHGGADGRVWLACSATGHLVVIKFVGRLDKASQALRQEAECWRSIWGVSSARITTLGSYPALLMPFAFHISTKSGRPVFLFPNHWAKTLHGGGEQRVHEMKEDLLLEPEVEAADPLQVARDAITAMVKTGYRHDDVEWRHVALLPDLSSSGWTLRPILIDLHRVSRLERALCADDDAKQRLIEKQYEDLEKTMSGTAGVGNADIAV